MATGEVRLPIDSSEWDKLWAFVQSRATGFLGLGARRFTHDGAVSSSPCCLVAKLDPPVLHHEWYLLVNPNSPLLASLIALISQDDDRVATDLLRMMLDTASWPAEFCPTRLTRASATELEQPMYQHNGWSLEVPGPHRLALPHRVFADSSCYRSGVDANGADFGLLRHSFVTVCQRRDAAIQAELTAPPEKPCQALGERLLIWSPGFAAAATGRSVRECVFGHDGSVDWVWVLSLFFGVPLVDRTFKLPGQVRCKVINPLPSAHDALSESSLLSDILDARAREICARADKLQCAVEVLWSGGIDSTAALVALLRAGVRFVRVRYHESSIAEYAVFYDRLQQLPNVELVHFEEDISQSEHPSAVGGTRTQRLAEQIKDGAIVVTGELGDQLFGSHLMRRAFYGHDDPQAEQEDAWRILRKLGLEAKWTDVILPIFDEKELLPKWISQAEVAGALQPWLDAAPFAIVSTFDFLWWVNFSLKWQHVCFRMFNGRREISEEQVSRVVHFYDHRGFELWAMHPDRHRLKMPDLSRWTSYKWPLKEYIFSYTGDEAYLQNKEKEGSFRHDALAARNAALDDSFQVIGWGVCSLSQLRMRERYGDRLLRFLCGVTAFDGHKEFFDEDLRRERISNPVVRRTLELKCGCLLPPDLVRGRSVLDLGACLGAMGQWALFHGASRYTAVEVQPDFVQASQRYLAHWGDRVDCILSDVRQFLSVVDDGAFDIVVVAGVLHCFLDPLGICKELARVAAYAVVVETIHPTAVRTGAVSDDLPMLQAYGEAPVNMQKSFASLVGLSVFPSAAALKLTFELAGFEFEDVDVPASRDPAVAIYARVLPGTVHPVRFFVRFIRRLSRKLQTLEDGLVQLGAAEQQGQSTSEEIMKSQGFAAEDWGRVGDKFGVWKDASRGGHQEDAPPAHGETGNAPLAGDWAFDESVAARFEHEARQHIPGYEDVVALSVEVACMVVPPEERSVASVVDIGCAIGFTLKALVQAGFQRPLGVDNSEAMLCRARVELASLGSLADGVQLVESSHFPVNQAPFDVVLINWTLHFVHPNNRRAYLAQTFRGLKPGGLLVLTEKTTQNHLAKSLYHRWKSQQGVSAEEIEEKARRIEGVLITQPLAWYLQALQGIGFCEVDVVHSRYGFVTLQARRPAAGPRSGQDVGFGEQKQASQRAPQEGAESDKRARELGFLANSELWDLPINVQTEGANDSRSSDASGATKKGRHGSGRVSHASLATHAARCAELPEPSDSELKSLDLLPESQTLVCLSSGGQQHLRMPLDSAAKLELAAGPEERFDGKLGERLVAYIPNLVYILRNRVHSPFFSGCDVDRTISLGRLFGYPVLDRTGTLSNGLKCEVLHPIPVFDPSFNKPLEDVMLARARHLLDGTTGALHLLWSGGIDSTAMVIAFKRVASSQEWTARVFICYCERSRTENPAFFRDVVEGAPSQVQIDGHVRDFADGTRRVVLADPADMLFGTGFMAGAFRDEPGHRYPNRLRAGLAAPWRDVIPAMLRDRDLLAPGKEAENKWVHWIRPLLEKSPVPVRNVFDFLWWTTFALKWQHDVMRFFYNRDHVSRDLVESVCFFFITDDFQQWSFHHHEEKMQDLTVWASYKWPLKRFILDFTGDKEYYAGKIKVASASHSWGYQLAMDDQFNVIRFGECCVSRRRMREKYDDQLQTFVESESYEDSSTEEDSEED